MKTGYRSESTDAVGCLDFNNFFYSCQAEFKPSDKNRVGVVLGPNDGCVIARSREAKQAGITMGAPLFKVEPLLREKQGVIYSANFPLYGDLSARAFELLNLFSPDIEEYSIDEAFFLLSPGRRSLENCLRHIHSKMEDFIGLPNTIGAGLTKVQSKLALNLGKKSDKACGVVNLYKSTHYHEALKRTPVGDIWRIGPRSAEKLNEANIFTAWDFHEEPHYNVRKLLTVAGSRVLMELRGKKCFPLEIVEQTKKSIGCRRTLGAPITDYRDVRSALLYFLSLACARLRKNNLAAKSITVSIGTDRFRPFPFRYRPSAQHVNYVHSNFQQELQEWAIKCLDRIYREGFEYKNVGVVLGGLIPADSMTYRLYEDETYIKWEKMFRAFDAINAKFGRQTVRLGSVHLSGAWRGKQLRKSPAYTTRIEDVPVV